MMFPTQFLQVPNENELQTAYDGFNDMGAFTNHLGHPNNANDIEARWFDENTAIMNIVRVALGNRGNGYQFGDLGWGIAKHFEHNNE
jgi:hypothetical protein